MNISKNTNCFRCGKTFSYNPQNFAGGYPQNCNDCFGKDMKSRNTETLKTGNNGILFGEGYKGKGMCNACYYSKPMKLSHLDKSFLFCGYYGKRCQLVCRNCNGIKIFRSVNKI